MADIVHKYYCLTCRLYIFAESTALLAQNVNTHNNGMHPTAYANWTSSGILESSCYTAGMGPLPQYLAPHGVSSHNPELLDQKITQDDRKFLAAGLVRW